MKWSTPLERKVAPHRPVQNDPAGERKWGIKLLSLEEARDLLARVSRNEHLTEDEMRDLQFFISEVM